ncbi:MAG: hypothetical protein RBJ76_15895 [Stenomitos frigidus ULC029]
MTTILIIERDAQFLEILKEWLLLYEFTPITASTLDEGYMLTYLKQPALILCGYGSPQFDGLRLLQTLQNDPDKAIIPFLLMTGAFLEDIPDWQHHLRQGRLLFKPFDLMALAQTLRLKLLQTQLLDDNEEVRR